MIQDAYETLCTFEALYKAHQALKKSRRYKTQVVEFDRNASIELVKLVKELETETYQISPYTSFTISTPKRREIQMLNYRDKVVQRALCDEILNGYIRNHVIYDNAACQIGKGVQFAIDRFTKFLHKFYNQHNTNGYILKTDIQAYYASMDHQVLKQMITHEIADEKLLRLITHIIDSYGDTKGIPMGNQLSQIFAIMYMNELDRLVKEQLHIKYYSRYIDDTVMLSEDKFYLKYCHNKMKECIETKLHLKFNHKTKIVPIKNGIDYLGFHFYLTPTGKVIKKLRTSNKKTTIRKLKQLRYERKQGILSNQKLKQKQQGIAAHLKKGDTYRLRQKLNRKYGLGG